jgi:ABC-2 type transport system permease protein
MRRLRFLLEKEFLQIFRNKAMLPIIFIMPAIQLIVLSFVATYELKDVKFIVVDHDQSQISTELIQKFRANTYFSLGGYGTDIERAKAEVTAGRVDMVMVFPSDMERKVNREESVRMLLMIDAVSSNKASLIRFYSQSILQDYNRSLRGSIYPSALANRSGAGPGQDRSGLGITDLPTLPSAEEGPMPSSQQTLDLSASSVGGSAGNTLMSGTTASPAFTTTTRVWYNPSLDYVNYMVPGILVVLITMIALFLSGMNIVREKEIGTMEQLNVTPIRKSEFIISKLLPMWALALVELGVGLLIAYWIFSVPFEGSVWVIYATAAVYLVAVQGIGLYISTITNTQQQAMFLAWFVMVIFILMGGLFTPIESMPEWAQDLTYVNPVAYFIDIMRKVMLKGAGFPDFWPQVLVLFIFAVISIGFSILQYRKVSTD